MRLDIKFSYLVSRQQCNVNQFFCRGDNINGSICKKERSFRSHHDIHPGDGTNVGLCTNDLKSRPDGICIFAFISGYKSICISCLYHHDTKIVRIMCYTFCIIQGNPFPLSFFK